MKKKKKDNYRELDYGRELNWEGFGFEREFKGKPKREMVQKRNCIGLAVWWGQLN